MTNRKLDTVFNNSVGVNASFSIQHACFGYACYFRFYRAGWTADLVSFSITTWSIIHEHLFEYHNLLFANNKEAPKAFASGHIAQFQTSRGPYLLSIFNERICLWFLFFAQQKRRNSLESLQIKFSRIIMINGMNMSNNAICIAFVGMMRDLAPCNSACKCSHANCEFLMRFLSRLDATYKLMRTR